MLQDCGGDRQPRASRSRRARWIHGQYSREAREARWKARMMQPSTEYERRVTMRRLVRMPRPSGRGYQQV